MKAKQTIASILAAQYVTENETEDHKIPFGVARYYGRLKAQTTMQEYKQHKIDMSTIEARLCEYELKQTRKEAYPWPLNRLIAA
jgi:hypothetical protein